MTDNEILDLFKIEKDDIGIIPSEADFTKIISDLSKLTQDILQRISKMSKEELYRELRLYIPESYLYTDKDTCDIVSKFVDLMQYGDVAKDANLIFEDDTKTELSGFFYNVQDELTDKSKKTVSNDTDNEKTSAQKLYDVIDKFLLAQINPIIKCDLEKVDRLSEIYEKQIDDWEELVGVEGEYQQASNLRDFMEMMEQGLADGTIVDDDDDPEVEFYKEYSKKVDYDKIYEQWPIIDKRQEDLRELDYNLDKSDITDELCKSAESYIYRLFGGDIRSLTMTKNYEFLISAISSTKAWKELPHIFKKEVIKLLRYYFSMISINNSELMNEAENILIQYMHSDFYDLIDQYWLEADYDNYAYYDESDYELTAESSQDLEFDIHVGQTEKKIEDGYRPDYSFEDYYIEGLSDDEVEEYYGKMPIFEEAIESDIESYEEEFDFDFENLNNAKSNRATKKTYSGHKVSELLSLFLRLKDNNVSLDEKGRILEVLKGYFKNNFENTDSRTSRRSI